MSALTAGNSNQRFPHPLPVFCPVFALLYAGWLLHPLKGHCLTPLFAAAAAGCCSSLQQLPSIHRQSSPEQNIISALMDVPNSHVEVESPQDGKPPIQKSHLEKLSTPLT
jgi:hypothetical protein